MDGIGKNERALRLSGTDFSATKNQHPANDRLSANCRFLIRELFSPTGCEPDCIAGCSLPGIPRGSTLPSLPLSSGFRFLR